MKAIDRSATYRARAKQIEAKIAEEKAREEMTASEKRIADRNLQEDAKALAEMILEAYSKNGEFNLRTSPYSTLDIRLSAVQFLREHRSTFRG